MPWRLGRGPERGGGGKTGDKVIIKNKKERLWGCGGGLCRGETQRQRDRHTDTKTHRDREKNIISDAQWN